MATRWNSKHTGQKIDDTIDYVSNPNLLDNWYFTNPVNQRGQTSWVNPSNWQYSIDRWQITPSSVVALADDGITVTADLQQGLEKDRLEFGRTYTFSVLSSDGRLGKHTFVLTSNTDINVGFGFGYFVCYLSGGNVWFRIYGDGSTYKAVKLEVGSQQTLAHQDADGNWVLNEIPDYGEQLRRCQYYSRFFGYDIEIPCSNNPEGNHIEGTLPLTMRSGSGAISYGNSNLFLGNGTYYPVTSASVTSNGGRIKIGVNVNGQMTSNQQATLYLTNCSILFDL